MEVQLPAGRNTGLNAVKVTAVGPWEIVPENGDDEHHLTITEL